MSEEKRIDRLEVLYIENKVSIESHDRMIVEIKASTDKIASDVSSLRDDFSNLRSEFSSLRNEFFKLGERLTWRIITFSSVGGAVAGILTIFFGTGGN